MIFEIKIEISDIDADCTYCPMDNNCRHSFKECRLYNIDLWKPIDQKIRNFRKKIHEIVKKNQDY